PPRSTLFPYTTLFRSLHHLGEPPTLVGIQAEDLAEVAQRAFRPVHDHGRRDRRPLPAVLLVNVLDDLLAPLVLEIDVDVGRLIALARDEALEEQRCAAQGVDGGHTQAKADAGVGGGPPTLAQDVLIACKRDDIVHGQEVRLVAQVRDEGELVLDGLALALRHTLRPAPTGPRFRELAQVARGSLIGRYQLMRILVPQLLQ